MKEHYEALEIELVIFSTKDILTSSSNEVDVEVEDTKGF